MEARFRKFQESLQPAVKLQIAAEDYFKEGLSQSCREVYRNYLKSRLRPGAQLLILEEDTDRLEGLWAIEAFSGPLTEDLLQFSIENQKPAAYTWLLRKKQETWGFHPRDYRL